MLVFMYATHYAKQSEIMLLWHNYATSGHTAVEFHKARIRKKTTKGRFFCLTFKLREILIYNIAFAMHIALQM